MDIIQGNYKTLSVMTLGGLIEMPTPNYTGSYKKLFPKTMSSNSFLTIYILKVLNEKNRKMYGKEIIDYIEERFNGMLKPSHGLMYPILRKLEELEFVEAEWEGNDSSKKTRRFYSITEEGRFALEKELKNYKPVVLESYALISSIMSDFYPTPVAKE